MALNWFFGRPTKPAPLGRATRKEIESCSGWEQLRAQEYRPNPADIAAIRERAAGVEVLAFLGAWCGDSKRDVPRFWKIMDQAGWPEEAITLICCDYDKRDPEELAAKWNIVAVPTFVFLRDGVELGRVVERPKESLEGDMAKIIAG
jgi:thiol-disulfide isomerase/thioredoxin